MTTAIDVSNNSELNTLYCGENHLTTLDLSKNTAVRHLSCFENELTAIILPENSALSDLFCECNKISGENMDNLINSLPQNTSSEINELGIFDSTNSKEGNVCTKAHVAATKAKGWQPLYWDKYTYSWEDYEGCE